MQAGAAGAAVVVDVVDGDLRHAELVEDALAASAVAVAVARHAHVDVVVVDARVQQRLDARLEAHLVVVDLPPRFDELGHAHAQHVARLLGSLLFAHGCGSCLVSNVERRVDEFYETPRCSGKLRNINAGRWI